MTDDEKCWNLMQLHNSNRIDYNTKKWETVKFFQTLNTAILGAAIAGICAIYIQPSFPAKVWLLMPFLPVSVSISSLLAIRILKHQSRLLYIEELQIFKLARLMNLDIEIPEGKRWLPKEIYLLSEKWKSPKFGTKNGCPENIDEWLNLRMRNHIFYGAFNYLFFAQIALSCGLLVVILVSSR